MQSIPLVIAFKDGAPVAEFVGAHGADAAPLRERACCRARRTSSSRRGWSCTQAGTPTRPKSAWRGALAKERGTPPPCSALARVLGERGETNEALALLERISAARAAQAAAKLAAELRTGASAPAADLEGLRARAAARPDDLATQLELGRALAAARRYDEALPALLAVVERDKDFADEAARKAMVDLFGMLGSDHPLVAEYRSGLARVLFR